MKQVIDIPQNVDEYIAAFPTATQKLLKQIREIITNAAPDAEEVLSYHMPAYKLHGVLVYFAAYKNHIGFYPGASGIEQFKKEITAYKWAKGSVQFPLHQKLPIALITKIVAFRVKENFAKPAFKKLAT